METIENQIKNVILQRYKSVRAFTQAINIPYSTIDNMFRRGIGGIGVQTVIKICNALDIDVESLHTGQIAWKANVNPTLVINELSNPELLEKYSKLDFFGRRMVTIVVNEEYNRVNYNNSKNSMEEPESENVIELNFSEQPSSAGTGYWLDEEQMIKKKVILNRDTAKSDLCIPVSGDSMTPLYHDGDILLVRKQPAVDIGEIGIFTIDGAGYVKKFGIGQLESLNPEYEPIPINEDTNLICNGKVLGILNPDWIID